MIEINPTCVPRDASSVGTCAKNFEAFASRMQVDIDDGTFAPHLTWPYTSPGTFEPFTFPAPRDTKLELHLMVAEPKKIGIACAKAGAERVIGHFEAFGDKTEIVPTLRAWREDGAREVGVAVLFQTSLEELAPYVSACDFVLMMSIRSIGVQGIPYEAGAAVRIADFHTRNPETVIAVDGGVSKNNIQELVRAGATRFGVGSAIAKAPDQMAAYEELKKLAESVQR